MIIGIVVVINTIVLIIIDVGFGIAGTVASFRSS